MTKINDLNSKLLIDIGRGKIGALRDVTEQLQKIVREPIPSSERSSSAEQGSKPSAEPAAGK
jgi:hypothetical protein